MDNILVQLLENLKAINTDPVKKFNKIDIMTDSEALLFIRNDQYPAVTISAMGEDHYPSDLSMINEAAYKVKVRLWYVALQQNNPRTKETGFRNIFEASKVIEETLLQDKKLHNKVNGLKETLVINDWNFFSDQTMNQKQTFVYVGRDIELVYFKRYEQIGTENSQPSMVLPEGIEGCYYTVN